MTWRRGEAGSTLIDRPNDDPVPDFHECQGKGYPNLKKVPSRHRCRIKASNEKLLTRAWPLIKATRFI